MNEYLFFLDNSVLILHYFQGDAGQGYSSVLIDQSFILFNLTIAISFARPHDFLKFAGYWSRPEPVGYQGPGTIRSIIGSHSASLDIGMTGITASPEFACIPGR